MINNKVIVAPDVFYPAMHQSHRSIFLAGAIDMGAAVNWQQEVIASATYDYVVFLNPRRKEDFTPDMLDEQVLWELDMMQKADAILMWFPADSKAPVAMWEAGLHWMSGKLHVGAEPGFYRRRNLELYAQWFGLTLYDNLTKLVEMTMFNVWHPLGKPFSLFTGTVPLVMAGDKPLSTTLSIGDLGVNAARHPAPHS